jgi:RNA polymerase sigma-70 factor (ECF subfamily)
MGDALAPDVVETLRHRVVRAVRRNCPAWLTHQAEDIVQNVLVQLVGKLRRSETNPGLSAMYVEKAAYGATVDAIRKLSRRRENPSDADSLERSGSKAAGPDRRVRALEIGQGIRDCLTGLVPPRRLGVTLYLQGCSVAEVAERRRWNFKRAQNLVYRGLADLRRCLENKGLAP